MPASQPSTSTLSLTAREREVLALIAEGRSNTEIADALGVSFPTAKAHVSHILAKLGVESREEAARWWDEHGGEPERPSVFADWVRKLAHVGLRPVTIVAGVAAVAATAALALLLVLTLPGDQPAAGLGRGPWVALLPDHRTMESLPPQPIRLVNLATGEERTLGEPAIYFAVAWSPDGSRLIALAYEGGDQFCPVLFDIVAEETTRLGCALYVRLDSPWSHDSRRLFLTENDSATLAIYSRDGDELGSLEMPFSGEFYWGISPDDKHIVAVSLEGDLAVLNSSDGTQIAHITRAEAVAYFEDAYSSDDGRARGTWLDDGRLLIAGRWSPDQPTSRAVVATVGDDGITVAPELVPSGTFSAGPGTAPWTDLHDELSPEVVEFPYVYVSADGEHAVAVWGELAATTEDIHPTHFATLVDGELIQREIDAGWPIPRGQSGFGYLVNLVVVE